jgi:TonB-dependent starch-binding outer membrane protein SusC
MQLALMRKCAMFLMALFGLSAIAMAQTVTGTVTDKKGDPIPGITVSVKGTKNATSTNTQGVYSLNNVAADAVLRFSGAGFISQESKLNGSATVSTSLETSVSNLNEVVVVGYGTRKVKDLTGSVAQVTSKDFNKGQIASPDQLLQGRTAGVLVTPSSGEPGAAPSINIRGSASIRGNQEPLYVVDGVPMATGGTSASLSGVEGSSTPKNPLVFLNPNDIESITVLKDASASAIYGSRGANGVIMITTKAGKGGKKGQLNFSAATSFSSTRNRYDLMNAQDFLIAAKKANIDGGADPIIAEEAVRSIDGGANTDWQDEIFRSTISQNYNLSWGYNTKQTNVRVSGSYDDQQGIVKNSSLKRLTGRLNLTQKFFRDKLKFDLNSTFSNNKSEYPPLSNNAGYSGSLLGAALQFNPTNPVYNPDGSFYQPGDQRNPSQMLAYFEDKDNVNRSLNSLTTSFEIVKGLTYKAVLAYDKSTSERTAFADPRLGSNAYGGTNAYQVLGVTVPNGDLQNGIAGNGRTTRQNVDVTSFLVEHYLTYQKTFGKHDINIVGGFSYQSFVTETTTQVGWGLNTPVVKPTDNFVRKFENFKNYRDLFPTYDKNELQSYYIRPNYSFDDRFFITGTVRVDGSSKFGKNNRYGVFPAFGAKWRVSNEKWAANNIGNVFGDFAIRANYGIIGSQDGLSSYAALKTRFIYDIGNGPQNLVNGSDNPDLKWEEAKTTGIGIDFTMKNNRLSGTIDYFHTKRSNLIFNGFTPGGFAPTARVFENLEGYVDNKGLEVSLTYKVVNSKKFNWDISYNMTYVKNQMKEFTKLVNTGVVNGQGLSGAFAQVIDNNQSLFTWSMPVFNGFDGNGNARYEKGAANQYVGSAIPTFFAGLTNNFSVGNWSLSVFLNAVTGHKVYNNTANALFLKGSLRNARNVINEVGKGPENPFNPGSVSTRFLEKGDFVRLSNVNLSYNFNLKSKAIRSFSAFISGQNLALWTNYTGLDPEVNVDKNIDGVPSRGFDYTNYPRPRVITVGVNLGF